MFLKKKSEASVKAFEQNSKRIVLLLGPGGPFSSKNT
jgi:hypothetical protein